MDQLDNRFWLIFDIDGTLLYSCDNNNKDITLTSDTINLHFLSFDNTDFINISVIKRPGLDELLDYVTRFFNVAIWSVGQPNYVNEVVKILFKNKTPPKFVYNWTNCHRQFLNNTVKITKPLSSTPAPKDKTLIIDDSLEVIDDDDLDNVIIMKRYEYPNPKDKELRKLKNCLEKLLTAN